MRFSLEKKTGIEIQSFLLLQFTFQKQFIPPFAFNFIMNGFNESPSRKFKLRGLKKNYGSLRTNDDVHRSIKLCPLTLAVMDTPHMQRLRGLKQLGVSEFTYVPTTHCRFEHSLGTAHLAEQMLREIKNKQPNLNIEEKDIICVKIAGLLHDIGHGPFSHIYDGQFRSQLKKAENRGEWLGQPFDLKKYEGLPNPILGWEHEDGSLMMIDALLRYLGLEIDKMNLDEPLKQVGDGIDARCFGIFDYNDDDDNDLDENYDGRAPLPSHCVLTSRDWIFIKECIVGNPLPPDGVSVSTFKKSKTRQQMIGRQDIYQEFLYDIISNRHSGLDVDKMDYYARDERRAFGVSGYVDPMLLENAYIAWGKCGNPSKCWKCRHSQSFDIKPSANNEKGDHLMIVYPTKMLHSVMNFFKTRFRNHQNVYTHPTTCAAGYMICDIFLLADSHFRLPSIEGGDHIDFNAPVVEKPKERKSLPISRANCKPESYLMLKDSILDIISATEDPNLRAARVLINRFRAHRVYKKVAEEAIVSLDSWMGTLWNKSETEIAEDIVKQSQLQNSLEATYTLKLDDVIVEKRQIHHGMKDENPVNNIRFLPKSQLSKLRNPPQNLPVAEAVDEMEYECSLPRNFLQRTLRVYCRSDNQEVCDHLTTCYHSFIEYVKKQSRHLPNRPQRKNSVKELNILSQSPKRYGTYSNETFAISQSSFHDEDDVGKDSDGLSNGSNKKRRFMNEVLSTLSKK